jgi:hypothetical protein
MQHISSKTKPRLFLAVFFFLLLSFLAGPGCLTIMESYEFRDDGSGKTTFMVDVSEMVNMMTMFGNMGDSLSEEGSMDEQVAEMFRDNSQVLKLSEIPGIRNVQSLNDRERNTIGYSYEFESVEALNLALAASDSGSVLSGITEGQSLPGGENSFSFEGKRFSRKHPSENMKPQAQDDEEGTMGMMSMMMADAKYTISYTFEGRMIKKADAQGGQISNNGRTLTQEVSLIDMMKGESNLGSALKLK